MMRVYLMNGRRLFETAPPPIEKRSFRHGQVLDRRDGLPKLRKITRSTVHMDTTFEW